jgi:hypothetical protein
MMSLDQATITVTDADGQVVGTGRTVNAGAAEIAVSKGRLPFLISTSGGTVRGRAFEGHLQAVTGHTTATATTDTAACYSSQLTRFRIHWISGLAVHHLAKTYY